MSITFVLYYFIGYWFYLCFGSYTLSLYWSFLRLNIVRYIFCNSYSWCYIGALVLHHDRTCSSEGCGCEDWPCEHGINKVDYGSSTKDADNDQRFEQIEALVALLQQPSNHTDSSHSARGNGSGGNCHKLPAHLRGVHVHFPKFDGFHVLYWLFKVEQFFEYYQILDD